LVSKKKLAFDENLFYLFFNDLQTYFPEMKKEDLKSIARNKLLIKLNQLNNHFFGLINGEASESLKEYDLIGFDEYEDFSNNLTKFYELDMKIDGEKLIIVTEEHLANELHVVQEKSNFSNSFIET
jgi:hypothetical protein